MSLIEALAFGDGNDIYIETKSLELLGSSRISTNSLGTGNIGNINIKATNLIKLVGPSLISTTLHSSGKGKGGNISLTSNSLELLDGASIDASTLGMGDGGNININASEIILDEFSTITSQIITTLLNPQQGNGGDISIDTNTLEINNGSDISTSQLGIGQGGNIFIKATDSIKLEDALISSDVLPVGFGDGGDIDIETKSLSLLNSKILAKTSGTQGDAGNVTINVQGLIAKNNSEISVTTNAPGNAGNIFISNNQIPTQQIDLDNSTISTKVLANATPNPNTPTIASEININTETLNLTNKSTITASTQGGIDAGNINIEAKNLNLNQASTIETFTRSDTEAGNIIINSIELITITDNDSGLFAQTENAGNAGNITINTPQLNISEGATISAFTDAEGNSGNIDIISTDAVTLGKDSNLTVETSGAGKAGEVNITSPTITIGEDAQISATVTETATNLEGGGSININASNLNISGKLGVFAETQSQAPAGDLTIKPDNEKTNLDINFTDNGFISASTTATGDGGSINISAPQTINISGEGKIAVETTGSGNAGIINISTPNLNLKDGLEISASTSGAGNSGNITLNAANLNLDNATISALTTGIGNPGSILITNEDNNANNFTLTNSTYIDLISI